MRKTAYLLMVVFLIGCVVFTMTGCGKKKPTPTADPPADPEPYTWSQNFDGVAAGTSLAGLGFDLPDDDNVKPKLPTLNLFRNHMPLILRIIVPAKPPTLVWNCRRS